MADKHLCAETPGTGVCFVCGRKLWSALPVADFRGESDESLRATWDPLGDRLDDSEDMIRYDH